MSDPFIGEIRPFGFSFAPLGWAFCDGQQMIIQQNTALYAVIGITFGGNGTTNFNLPDLRGRAAMHKGQGSGLTNRTIGNAVGAESVQLASNQIPSHTHALTAKNVSADSDAPGGHMLANSQKQGTRGTTPMSSYVPGATATTAMSSSAISPVGSGTAHENMQPYTSLNLCIAVQGIFPVRS